jgi:hypothetical protein
LLGNCIRLQAHVIAELLNSNNLVLLLAEVLFNFLDELSSISITPACDYLNVFRVNAQTIHVI